MNQEWERLFSVCLDGRATPAECRQAESLIQHNPQARELWEKMQELHSQVTASKPEAIQAPPEFRQMLMRRLAALNPESHRPSPSAPAPGFQRFLPWLIAGTVLAALVGSLLYSDWKKALDAKAHRQERKTETLDQLLAGPEPKPVASALPVLPLPGPVGTKGVKPDSIQSLGSKTSKVKPGTGAQVLSGQVYILGKGQAKPAPVTPKVDKSSEK